MSTKLIYSLLSFGILSSNFSAMAMEEDTLTEYGRVSTGNIQKMGQIFHELIREIRDNGGDPQKVMQLRSKFDGIRDSQHTLNQYADVLFQQKSTVRQQTQEESLINQGYNRQAITPVAHDTPMNNQNVISLDLTENEKISGYELSNIKNLDSLNLTRNIKISGYELSNLKNLTSLDLTENEKISGYELSNLKNLDSLNLTRNTKISGYELSNLKNLTSLDLTENEKISGYELSRLKLNWLNLTRNTKISSSAILSLKKQNPNIVIIGRVS